MKKLVIFFYCIVQSLAILAHQDTPLKLRDDGTLKGLPEQYSNPTFDLKSRTLCIGENKITIPECVKSIFMDDQIYLNHISASWYHDPELLPLYIHIDINGFEIYFNLETLEIFQISQFLMFEPGNKGNAYKLHEHEISNDCRTEISNPITKR